jgi:hypothetical protein
MEKSRRFGYWVWIVNRTCRDCGAEHRMVAGDTRRAPSLPPGAIRCYNCDGLVIMGRGV